MILLDLTAFRQGRHTAYIKYENSEAPHFQEPGAVWCGGDHGKHLMNHSENAS
ncbi:hypothetical protein HMPREF0578_0668 [Mobiluncus mulieris 28-1]|uniref:Uncharacterized protein n=1 Tax=Mobiluncus mulieris TaxID=2052 RepID=A0A7Y0U4U0_9ACTO|nr:hypothetical protein [Mobiluncus mulieris]EEZ90739.1 hypothetical protein HMPREF0578_0668 [Mobiluncus mulieris 28-1]NMW74602.1 hypothetical protein [Mobiluncus mulieris]NMX03045.1 hypothetical protein [Mobiluncus mulieris]